MSAGNAHLNLVESSRQLFELDPGAAVEAGAGWLFGSGTPKHPVVSNAAFRTDDGIAPDEFLARASGFFEERGGRFTVWARAEEPRDEDLIAAAEAAGLQNVYEMPEMLLGSRTEEPPLPAGAELRRIGSSEEIEAYWRIAASSYVDIGFPPETFGFYENHAGMRAENVAAFIAYLDGEPVSIAMTIVSHGVAGIYWVGSLKQARGKGLGRAVTAAATNAGFDLGAEIASLQASPMGKPIYEAMGYETIFDYRLLLSPAKP